MTWYNLMVFPGQISTSTERNGMGGRMDLKQLMDEAERSMCVTHDA